MSFVKKYKRQILRIEEILGYEFTDKELILSAITHPSAIEGRPIKYSYERLEFLGDAVLGAIVVRAAYLAFPEMDEGGLTRIKVSLVNGSTLSKLAEELGFKDVIVFGSSETGTGKRGMHSALENVYESVVGALFLDGGMERANSFVTETLLPLMDEKLSLKPENPKSMLQEKFQEKGVTPSYEMIKAEGPPHDRTFVVQVVVDKLTFGKGKGKSKKEAEVNAAKETLQQIDKNLAKIDKTKKKMEFKFPGDFLFKRGDKSKKQG